MRILQTSLLRASVLAQRPSAPLLRTLTVTRAPFAAHQAETFEAFTERYTAFFEQAEDLFEVQRGLNNCFAYDLVPSPVVCEAAIRAARRCNDYSTAVRVFEAIKEKVENTKQYQEYLTQMKPLREELGIDLHEEMYTKEA